MKRIIILVDQFHQHGGIEKLVALKANYWVAYFNYEVTIVSTENKNKPLIYTLDKRVNFLDFRINYNRLKSYFSLRNIILLLKNVYAIQKYILRNKPDVLIVASHIPITYILPFLFHRNTRIVKEFHFSKFYYYQNKSELKKKIFNLIEAKYDRLVVLSEEEKHFYESGSVVVINNPVINSPSSFIKSVDEKELIAVTVIRFAPVKRIEVLVDIWERFSKKNNSWKLFIYGPLDNEYALNIQKQVIIKKLEEVVIFKGKTNSVFEELSNSRVVLITSEQECFPMLILEAQSVGVPVISFDCPTGPRNIIHTNEDGILIDDNNINAFVEALDNFCYDIEFQKKLSKGALKNSENYDLDHIMMQWYTEILNF